MAIPFVLVSNIFFPIGTVMGERLMYLPLLGSCLLVGQACQVLARRWEPVVAGAVVILLGLCGARTFVRNSDWQDNRTLFSSAVRTVPQSAKAQFNLGNALRDEGKIREALDRYRDALILYPDYVEVHYNLGVVYQEDGKLDWALVAYQKALTADSLHASTLHNCGMLLVRKGDHQEAADVFRRLVKVKPNSLDALSNYALALHRAGDHQKAAELYLQVLESDPGHEDAAINLGFLYQEVGYTAETIAVYKRVLQSRQDAYRVAYNLGVMLSRLGSLEKAIEAYRQAAGAMDERGAMALFQVGVLSQKMGRTDEARKAVEGFLMRWQGDPKMRVRAERVLRDLSENKN
jgi:tetratricopeptide (TPR) repeat protein